MRVKFALFPLLIIVAGVLFTLFLQSQVPRGVFFSGDAGLKALLAQQLSAGYPRFNLVLSSEAWVQNLWDDGLYPYEEPFVYQVSDRYYITFPFTFPLVTAPFHALFGYRGLYLIPLVSTWIIWGVSYWLCCRLKLDNFSTSIALILLIFSSPLTLYSAMYWEHTLAVALGFSGCAMLVASAPSELSLKEAVISGCLTGLAVWFRPEFLCLVSLLIVWVYLVALFKWKYRSKVLRRETAEPAWTSSAAQFKSVEFLIRNKNFFAASAVITIAVFFVLNQIVYGHFLGIHAIQVVEKANSLTRLKEAWKTFKGLGTALFIYFPVAYFPILYLLAALVVKKVKVNFQLVTVYLICLFFTIGVALLVPVGTAGQIAGGKQWGPRFLLILVPVIALIAVRELEYLRKVVKGFWKTLGVILVSLTLLIGFYKNTYEGTKFLISNNQGILPAIQFLETNPNKIVAISHQFVGQALEPAVEGKLFFQAQVSQDLIKLGAALVNRDEQEFIYICYPFRPCRVPKAPAESLRFFHSNQSFTIKFDKLGDFGKYPIYKASILRDFPQ